MNKPRLPGLFPLLVLPALYAQEPVRLDPVEVTAPLPSDALLTQPTPITAYNGELLTAVGVTTYDDLAPLVPGLFASPQSVENISLNLRGITTDAGDPRVPPRVPVFQDGVFIATPRGGGVALFDLENVEVLKGPQATAFGRGVQNGALSLASHRPINTSGGELTAGFGDNASRLATGYYNTPVVPEKLFARVAFSSTENEGYVDNLTPGAENLQGVDTLALRTSLRWQPAPDTTADLIFNAQRDTPPGIAFKSMVIPTSRADTDPYSAAELNRGDDLGIDRELWGLTGILHHRLSPAWQLAATSAFRDVDSLNEFDADGSRLFLFEFGEQTYERQLSQDLRFDYDAGGPLTGTIGAGAFWQEGRQDVTLRTNENVLFETFTGLPSPGLLPFYEEAHTNRSELLSADVFGRLDYKFTKKLTFGGGLRLTQEHITSGYQSYAAATPGNLGPILGGGPSGNNVFAPTPGMLETRGDHTSWSGGLDSRYAFTSRHHGYASVARGRRSPVHTFNQTTFAEERLAEEVVWNYEVGFKGATAGRRCQYGVSVFHYDYENFQTQTFVGVVPTPVNGGRAGGNGFELTLQGAVNTHVSLFATYGYTDAEFASRNEDGAAQAYAGNEFRLTSRHAFSVGGTLAHPAGDHGAVFVTPVVQYRSEQFFEDDNDAFGGQLRQGGFTLLNLRFGYRTNNGRWDVTAFVNNVLDKEYLIDAGNIGLAFGLATTLRGAPRTCGLQTTVRF